MGMTDKNLCDTCINYGCEFQSGIVRTKCAFYIPPTIEAIPKADYENRLKADMVTMLEELRLEFEEYEPKWAENEDQVIASNRTWDDFDDIIQQKINALKAESEPQESEENIDD